MLASGGLDADGKGLPVVYKPVSASLRVLEVLEALNAIGPAGLTAIHRRAGLPKATAKRMLDTLCAAGFVGYDELKREFTVGVRALALSSGYDADDAILLVARPIMAKLRKEVGWPCDLVICRNDELVIADTNPSEGMFSVVRRRGNGSRLPFTISATGRCFLAFCDAATRERILRFDAPVPEESASLMADRSRLERLIAETRERGYGLQSGEFFEEQQGAAVPVLVDGALRCCINIVVAKNAVSLAQVQERYVPLLLAAADEASARLP